MEKIKCTTHAKMDLTFNDQKQVITGSSPSPSASLPRPSSFLVVMSPSLRENPPLERSICLHQEQHLSICSHQPMEWACYVTEGEREKTKEDPEKLMITCSNHLVRHSFETTGWEEWTSFWTRERHSLHQTC
jgi:hypothetical protein